MCINLQMYHSGENPYSISTLEMGSISSCWNPTECTMLVFASHVRCCSEPSLVEGPPFFLMIVKGRSKMGGGLHHLYLLKSNM